MGGKHHLHTLCGLFREFPFPAVPRHCKWESANAEPLFHHSCTTKQITWVLLISRMPRQHTWKWSPSFFGTEVRRTRWRNNVGINFSSLRKDPGHRGQHQRFSELPGTVLYCFLPIVVVSTPEHPPMNGQLVPQTISTPVMGSLRAY